MPANLKHYDTPFSKNDSGKIKYLQLWYDPQTFELLTVVQYARGCEDSARYFIFSDKLPDDTDVSKVYPWTPYMATYQLDRKGLSIYGFMLVRNERQEAECKKILASLTE